MNSAALDLQVVDNPAYAVNLLSELRGAQLRGIGVHSPVQLDHALPRIDIHLGQRARLLLRELVTTRRVFMSSWPTAVTFRMIATMHAVLGARSAAAS